MATTAAAEQPRKISLGVLYLPHYQLLDAAGPIDLINMASVSYAGQFAAEPVRALAPEITWHYISAAYPAPVVSSTGAPTLPTTNLTHCPPLDYLLIPGPPPATQLSEAEKAFIVEQAAQPRLKAVMTVCTGSLMLSQTGLLNGINACTNKTSLRGLADAGTVPAGVRWCRDRRWVIDGKFWSSAGITAGMDLAVQWVRREVGEEVLQWVKEVAEYDPIEAGGDHFAYLLTDVKL